MQAACPVPVAPARGVTTACWPGSTVPFGIVSSGSSAFWNRVQSQGQGSCQSMLKMDPGFRKKKAPRRSFKRIPGSLAGDYGLLCVCVPCPCAPNPTSALDETDSKAILFQLFFLSPRHAYAESQYCSATLMKMIFGGFCFFHTHFRLFFSIRVLRYCEAVHPTQPQ